MILFAQKQQQLIVGGWVWFLDSREAQKPTSSAKKEIGNWKRESMKSHFL
jgi:hypothetical protein